MATWAKEEIVLPNGERESAQVPIIISASRSTDIPAFYADWFMERLKAGYVKWYNPFNGVPLYVSFDKARLFVFWSKNPAPMLAKLPGTEVSPIDILEREGRNYEYNTCPHLCHYCYANANNAAAMANWKRHQGNHRAETIISG